MKIKDIRRNNLKKKIFLTAIMFVVLGIGIGYAYLRDTLTLEDNAKMSMTWNVYFDNVQKLGNSIDSATTPTLNKTSFSTSLSFTDVSQFYEVRFDIKNDGSLDAMIDSYSTNPIPTNLQSYFDTSVTYYDGESISNNDLLAHGTKDGFKIKISIKNGVNISELPSSIPISFDVNCVKADSNATARVIVPPVRIISGEKGNLQPGDKVQVGNSEQFYVISSNSNTTVLLSKYNLLVGKECSENTGYEDQYLSPATEGYGLQSSYATGFNDLTSEEIAVVAFSSTNYWNNNGLISPYNANGASYSGNPYPNVYDNTYAVEPDFSNNGFNTSGYSIAYYVELYKSKLIEMGAPSTISARLLTYEEAYNKQNVEDNGTSIILGAPSFWLGSAGGYGAVWFVDASYSDFDTDQYSRVYNSGVRPVIEIPTSDID